jgi:hypothetical protein
MAVTQTLLRLRKDDLEIKASLGWVARLYFKNTERQESASLQIAQIYREWAMSSFYAMQRC